MQERIILCGINFISEIQVLCSIACWLKSFTAVESLHKVCFLNNDPLSNIEEHFKENCLHRCYSQIRSLTIGSEEEPQSYLHVTFPFSSSSPLKRALKIIIHGFQCSIFFYGFLRPTEEVSKTNICVGVIKIIFTA